MLVAPPRQPIDTSALLRATAHEAGLLALGYFRDGRETSARIWAKGGGSPVSEADMAVDSFLKERLSQALPEAGWLSEETADDLARLERRLVWIVDPIDGTRAFVAGDANWSISIALLADGRPVAGVVYAPARGELYEARSGAGAFLNGAAIGTSERMALAAARIAGPLPLYEPLKRQEASVVHLPKVPSLALRLARVADGSIDVGLVSAASHDWDIAAADLILQEAGGRLTDVAGRAPPYNRREPRHGVLAAANAALHETVLAALAAETPAGKPPPP
ncbi:inositol monophosphatase [Chelatococcus sp. SYSU_G07232]|uniref:Inositol monophosphatase n=1 Tax=Chelatococcus albus TaxID=3047466 RepID=A0ABT7ALH0_9HYPH|nr:inositol monophosphatase [Chelatococcus sp. SYSU_G07232]MDJ1160227.1 inositol monophosphatase [Chelatococcus sp. SYSU_G07232]